MLTYSFYGFDARVQQYARALMERGDEVDIIALRREGSSRHEVVDGVSVYCIQQRTRNERNQLAYFFRILRFLIHSAFLITRRHVARRYQLIHVHSVPDFLVFAALVPKLLGARVILDIHDILPEFYASKFGESSNSFLFKVLLFIERRSARFADHVIVANDLWCERIRARSAKNGNCSAFRNYPNPGRFFPRPNGGGNGKFVILYPGTLNWHQGVDVAVRAFAKIREQVPNAELHIYGEGPMREGLIALAGRLGLDGKVAFKDFVPASKIADVMATADLAVVPKRASSAFGNEAASTKIFEFMALGVPLVVSRTKIDSYYLNDSIVKFFESDNEDDLAHAILTMVQNPGLRTQISANALKYAASNTWEKKKLEYLGLIDSLVGPRKMPEAVKQLH